MPRIISGTTPLVQTQRPAFLARLNGDQALTSPTNVDFTQYFTVIDFNFGGHYSSSGGFKTPVTGLYMIIVQFYYYNAAEGEMRLTGLPNGNIRLSNSKLGANRNPFSASHTVLQPLQKGNTVKVDFSSVNNATMYAGNKNTHWSIALIG